MTGALLYPWDPGPQIRSLKIVQSEAYVRFTHESSWKRKQIKALCGALLKAPG